MRADNAASCIIARVNTQRRDIARANQMHVRRFCVRWYTIVIAAWSRE